MVATERRLVEQLRNDSKQKQRRNVSRGNAPSSQVSQMKKTTITLGPASLAD